jgi:enoyl-CoA hydratase/3-hydroxyacyl-CoA dehydrogenase
VNASAEIKHCFRVCRGGLIFWADLIGAQKIVARLDQLAGQFSSAGLAGFFEPCDYLRQAAASGRKLSAGPSAATSKL